MSTESVYLETTFFACLVSRQSRHVVAAGHQYITRDWWDRRRAEFECSISQLVIDEASAGTDAQERLTMLAGLPLLRLTEDAEALARAIVTAGILPPDALTVAAGHLAVAAVHGIDYLLTWDCRHLANAQLARRLAGACEKVGHRSPIICTPEKLMGM